MMGGKKVFELTLEIGHKSQLLKTPLANGYTHKWSIFVRSANNSKLEHCIQRVVFKLHDSFDNPHREITEPPYQVKETGYAGFEIPIEIYFKSRDRLEPVEFGLDLILLTDRPNQVTRLEKLKFYSPCREFEKCLSKAGAQLLHVTKNKKDRSVSPPTKKQKSYSLIPSKDMSNKQSGHQVQSHSHSNNSSHSHPSSASLTSHNSLLPSSHQTQQLHHRKSNSSSSHNHGSSHNNQSHSNNNQTNIGNNNNHSSSNLFGKSHHSNNQTIKRSSQQQASVLPKPKSSSTQIHPSSELMDVFGAPLLVNNNKSQKTSNGRDHSSDHNNRDLPMITSNNRSPIPPTTARQPSPHVSTQQSHKSHQSHTHHHKSSKHHHHQHKKHHHIKQEPFAETLKTPHPPPPLTAQLQVSKKSQQREAPPQQQAVAIIAPADSFQIIQNKISSLTDTDRLQKIVDIIEESGEWFNLTPSKFEFDLKRLDKKTLSKIEKCLP